MPSIFNERVTFLSTPEFKQFLQSKASEENISVAELIRKQFQEPGNHSEEEAILSALIEQVREMTAKAEASLDKGLRAIQSALEEKYDVVS